MSSAVPVRDGCDSDHEWLMELCLPDGKASGSAGSVNNNNIRDRDADDMEVDSLERLLHEDDCSGDPSQLSLKDLMAAGAEFCTERSFRRIESAASRYNDNPDAAGDGQGPLMMVNGRREQLVSANYYKTLVPAALHLMPRLEPVMRAVLQDPTILIEFSPTNQLASRVLSHAEGRIRMLIRRRLYTRLDSRPTLPTGGERLSMHTAARSRRPLLPCGFWPFWSTANLQHIWRLP